MPRDPSTGRFTPISDEERLERRLDIALKRCRRARTAWKRGDPACVRLIAVARRSARAALADLEGTGDE